MADSATELCSKGLAERCSQVSAKSQKREGQKKEGQTRERVREEDAKCLAALGSQTVGSLKRRVRSDLARPMVKKCQNT